MNHYCLLCLISGVILAQHASAKGNFEKFQSENTSLTFLYDKVNSLEVQWKILSSQLESKDNKVSALEDQVKLLTYQLKEKEDRINSLEEQAKALSSQVGDLHGHSAIEISFIVTATEAPGYIPTGVIHFDEKIVDHSNSFDLATSKFTAPSHGIYLFMFNSLAYHPSNSERPSSYVEVYVNYRGVYYFEDTGPYDHQHSFIFSLKLEEGDELWLESLNENTLVNYVVNPMTFVGYKTS